MLQRLNPRNHQLNIHAAYAPKRHTFRETVQIFFEVERGGIRACYCTLFEFLGRTINLRSSGFEFAFLCYFTTPWSQQGHSASYTASFLASSVIYNYLFSSFSPSFFSQLFLLAKVLWIHGGITASHIIIYQFLGPRALVSPCKPI